MPSTTLPFSVDEKLANAVDELAAVEGRPPSQIIAAALQLYLLIPPEAHRSFETIKVDGDDNEHTDLIRDLGRVLLSGEFAIMRRRTAASLTVSRDLPDEEAMMDEAQRMVRAASRSYEGGAR